MPKTKITIKLEEKRNSPSVQEFKKKVIDFLDKVNASSEIRYRLQCDLSKKIDMPFYGDKKQRTNYTLTTTELAKEYIKLLIEYGDPDFSAELLVWLTLQQSQTFRRLHCCSAKQKERKKQLKQGVYEHPVPVKYSRQFILECIKQKDSTTAQKYVDFMNQKVPQIFLTTEEDNTVNQLYRDCMPDGWDWKKDNPFIRYEKAGISNSTYEA